MSKSASAPVTAPVRRRSSMLRFAALSLWDDDDLAHILTEDDEDENDVEDRRPPARKRLTDSESEDNEDDNIDANNNGKLGADHSERQLQQRPCSESASKIVSIDSQSQNRLCSTASTESERSAMSRSAEQRWGSLERHGSGESQTILKAVRENSFCCGLRRESSLGSLTSLNTFGGGSRRRSLGRDGSDGSLTRRHTGESCQKRTSSSANGLAGGRHAASLEEIANFKASDLCHQIDEMYMPDKLDSWDECYPNHLQSNELMLFNAAQRQEVQCMKAAIHAVLSRCCCSSGSSSTVEGIPLPAWTVESIQALFGSHYEWVVRRVHALQAFVFPIYEMRFQIPAAVRGAMWRMENELHSLAKLVDSLEPDKGENNGVTISTLADKWDKYQSLMEFCNTLLENVVLMLYRSYYTHDEHVLLLQETEWWSRMSPHAFGVLVHCSGGLKFLRQPSGSDAALLVAEVPDIECKYREYVDNVMSRIDALQAGRPRVRRRNSTGEGEHGEGQGEDHGKGRPSSSFRSSNNRRLVAKQHLRLFNPLDPKFQKASNYPPDKLAGWEAVSPSHVREGLMAIWDHAHRCEVHDMKEVLHCVAGRGALSDWALRSIWAWWSCHKEWVLSCIELFRSHWKPIFESRIHYPPIIWEMQDEFVEHVHEIDDIVKALEVGDTVWRMYDLLDAWADYEEAVQVSLDLVETMFVMLNHAYFTRAEISSTFRAGEFFNKLSPYAVGSFLHHAGMDMLKDAAQVQSESRMMSTMWNADFERKLREYEETVVVHMNALREGVPPKGGTSSNLVSALLHKRWPGE